MIKEILRRLKAAFSELPTFLQAILFFSLVAILPAVAFGIGATVVVVGPVLLAALLVYGVYVLLK